MLAAMVPPKRYAGFLYASVVLGGAFGDGAYLKLSAAGVLKDVYILRPTAAEPAGPLVEAADGNLYGGFDFFGTYNLGLVGSLKSTTGVLSILYRFCAHPADGVGPNGGLVPDSHTNLYAPTSAREPRG